jgi:hypothetical protein
MAWFVIYIGGMIGTWLGPWWTVIPISFLAGVLFPSSGRSAALNGALGMTLLWGVATVTIQLKNGGLLADRIAPIFFLPDGWLLVLATILLGAGIGAFACHTGYAVRRMVIGAPSDTLPTDPDGTPSA